MVADAKKYGAWGDKVFAYPFQGFILGLFDPNLLVVRKIYTCSIYVRYIIAFIIAVSRLKQCRYSLLSLWFFTVLYFYMFLERREH